MTVTVTNVEQGKGVVSYDFNCGCDCVVDRDDGYVLLGISCRQHRHVDRRERIAAYREAINDYVFGKQQEDEAEGLDKTRVKE